MVRSTISILLVATTAAAQPAPEHPITSAQRGAVIEKLAGALERHYVFPDKGRALGQALRAHLARGDYGAHATGEQLARAVTGELVAMAHDAHLALAYVEAPPPAEGPDPEEAAEQRYNNYGIFEVRRLRFNLGYLRFNQFGRPAAQAADKLAAAMRLVADTAGLIVDLRDCHGGDTDTVTLAESYLVPAGTHLLDFYTRDDGKTERVRAATTLAGARYPADRPIFVLIGETTASGCEALAYTLQSQKRATLIGGHSAGAAHFGSPYPLADHFVAFIANGRPIDPITHADWEGTGVIPAIATEHALEAGEQQLLQVLAPREPSPRRKADMQKRIAELGSAR